MSYTILDQDLILTEDLTIKVYAQDSEPVLDADGKIAQWKDTDDSDQIYLVYRRGSGDQVKLAFTESGFPSYYYAVSEGVSEESTDTWQEKLSLSLPSISAGDYLIEWCSIYFSVNGVSMAQVRVEIDDTEISTIRNTGDWTREQSYSGFYEHTFTAGTHQVDIDFRSWTDGVDTARIKETRLKVKRVG